MGFKTAGLGSPQTKIYGGNDNSGAASQQGDSGAGKFKVTITNPSGTHQEVIYAENDANTASKFVRLSTNGSERLRINSNGAVGINTVVSDQPNAPSLHLHGSANDDCRISFSTPTKSNPGSRIGYYGLNRFGIDSYDGLEVRDVTDSYSTRFMIDNNGKSGFGHPSTYTDPYRLYLRYFWDSGAGYANGLVIDSRPDVLTTKHIRFYYALHGSGGGSELGSVTSSNAGSVSYNTSSDYRRKQNDVVITDGIAKVKTLRPIRFNWIEQPEITEEGFFAHEAQEVVPNSVFGAKDAVDKDGKPDYQVCLLYTSPSPRDS